MTSRNPINAEQFKREAQRLADNAEECAKDIDITLSTIARTLSNRLVASTQSDLLSRDAAITPTPDLNAYAQLCHEANAGWWHDIETGERIERNKGELLMHMVGEIAEAMEGERKDLMDDHLPHRRMAEVELADTLIRIFDYCGAYGYDIEGAVLEKLEYNRTRVDHTHEHRRGEGGKKW